MFVVSGSIIKRTRRLMGIHHWWAVSRVKICTHDDRCGCNYSDSRVLSPPWILSGAPRALPSFGQFLTPFWRVFNQHFATEFSRTETYLEPPEISRVYKFHNIAATPRCYLRILYVYNTNDLSTRHGGTIDSYERLRDITGWSWNFIRNRNVQRFVGSKAADVT